MEGEPISVDISLIKEVEPNTYEIPIGFVPNMKVPGRFFATPEIFDLAINEIKQWQEKTMTALLLPTINLNMQLRKNAKLIQILLSATSFIGTNVF